MSLLRRLRGGLLAALLLAAPISAAMLAAPPAFATDKVIFLTTLGTVDARFTAAVGGTGNLTMTVTAVASGTIHKGDGVQYHNPGSNFHLAPGSVIVADSSTGGTPCFNLSTPVACTGAGGTGTYALSIGSTPAPGSSSSFIAVVPTTYTVPADFSAVNKIEFVSGGGANNGRQAGAGAGYSKVTNVSLTPGATITYVAGWAGNATNDSVNFYGGDSWVANGTTTILAVEGGQGGTTSPSSGGRAAQGIGSTKFSGGAGGNATTLDGSGGGGSAGPNGDGGAGGLSNCASSGGGGGGGGDGGGAGAACTSGGGVGGTAGSTGNAGGHGASSGTPIGSNGGTGTGAWTSNPGGVTAGPGGGGGGSYWNGSLAAASTGGFYGGGGGGGLGTGTGTGEPGFGVITYTPTVSSACTLTLLGVGPC